jgi:membrane-associated phospholipid phosphatase
MRIAFLTALPKLTWREAAQKVQTGFATLWLRANRLAWMIVVTCAALLAVLAIAMGFDYAPVGLAVRLVFVLVLAAVLAGAGWPRAALLLESFALAAGTILVVPPLTSIFAAMAMPLQDSALATIDRWMGIDWIALAFWFRAHPELTRLLCDAYASILWQPVLLMVLLTFADPERMRIMMTASAIALAATLVGFFLVPALGPYPYFNFTHADFPDAINVTPWIQPGLIEALRNGSREVVFEGIVSFPSYHAATSILFAFGWIGVPVIGVPLVLMNMVMLIATVPIGGHYVIDIFAGVAVAFASLSLAMRYFRTTDTLPPLPTWDRTPEGRRILSRLRRLPLVSAFRRAPLKASHKEQAAAT